jgi:DNA excision repair protein ERCC-4
MIIMELLMDDREPAEIAYMLSETFSIKTKIMRLPRGKGDYCFSDIAVERKTIEDLISSLYDSRLWDQIKAMKMNFPHSYIIAEGILPMPYDRESYNLLKQIIGIYVGITKGFGITIIPSVNMKQTAYILSLMFIRSSSDRKEYLRPVKKMSVSDHDIRSDILCAIRGIGRKKADALLQECGSIKNICDLTVNQLKQFPGIGKARAELIYHILNGEDEESE